MKIAAIDLGSNSIHMVVAELTSTGGFHVLDRETEMVRLGAETLSTGEIPAPTVDRAIGILRTFKRLAQSHKVEEVVSLATSAIREARNGEDVLQRIGRAIGIWPRAISGEEEARLVYTAALHAVHLQGRRTLVVDIGGGSVEIVLGRGGSVDEAVSLKLGVIRLTEGFVKSDPVSARDEKKVVAYVRSALAPLAARVRKLGIVRAVGTSGTILALGRLALSSGTAERPVSLHHATVAAEAIRAVRKRLTEADLKRRLRIPGVDRRRADLLPAGAILLDEILSRLGIRELILCEWALREGILLDFASRQRSTLARAEADPDPRRRSVLRLAERCSFDRPHARHVTRLAVEIFDATRGRHRLELRDRALLEYAAMLHDVGQHISHRQHHKHSYYLIKHGDLRGFDPTEIEVMANVARYHTGGGPSRRHVAFGSLSRADRKRVLVLAGILRLAEALDRSHRQRIRSVVRAPRARGVVLRCHATGDVELEMWGARRHGDLLEDTLGLPVRVEIAAAEGRVAARRGVARIA